MLFHDLGNVKPSSIIRGRKRTSASRRAPSSFRRQWAQKADKQPTGRGLIQSRAGSCGSARANAVIAVLADESLVKFRFDGAAVDDSSP